MGQGIGGVPEAPAVGRSAVGGQEPIGRYIAQQRRLRGIELDELATLTRIPRRSLERLEAGAFDHSPDGFSRGFVRTVAEAIGLDPDDAVARMLPEPDATRPGRPRSGRVLGALAALVALAGVVFAIRGFGVGAATAVAPPPAPPLIRVQGVRRDYVWELAAAQGIAVAKLTARDAVLEPLPAELEVAAPIAQTADPAMPSEARGDAVPVVAPARSARPAQAVREVAAARPAPADDASRARVEGSPSSGGAVPASRAPDAEGAPTDAASATPTEPSPNADAEAHD